MKETKLGDKYANIIKKRNVSIEELIEFNEIELKQFGTDLGLDILSKNRLIKSIQKLKKINEPNKECMTMSPPKQRVIISSLEYEAMSDLIDENNKTLSSMTQIEKALNILNEFAFNDIEDTINSMINNLKNKRNILLQNIDKIKNNKINILNQQTNSMENYLKTVSDAKLKYEQYTKDQTMDHKQRKKLILNMTKNIMDKSVISMSMITAPKIQFDVGIYNKKLNKLYDFNEVK